PEHPKKKLIRSWKTFTARQITSTLTGRGSLVQRNYSDRLLRDEIIPLPKTSRTAARRINLSRSKCFPTPDQFLQRLFRALNKKCVDMIRHHNRCDQRETLTVEMTKCFANDLRAVAAAKKT